MPELSRNLCSCACTLMLFAASAVGNQTGPGGAADSARLTQSELQALAAPVALYPDRLLAIVLSAATFPDQIAAAAQWLAKHHGLAGKALSDAVDRQPWDASVKSLTQHPAAFRKLAGNLSWASALGEAHHNQPADLLRAIQTLRAKAKGAGKLKSSSQLAVPQQGGAIEIRPANPKIAYVPEYDPSVISERPIRAMAGRG